MAIPPDFPTSPFEILHLEHRWFPADEVMRDSSYEKLLPPLVHKIRNEVTAWRKTGYEGVSDTSKALLNWWFGVEHMLPKSDGTMAPFQYYFAQREALETIVHVYQNKQVYKIEFTNVSEQPIIAAIEQDKIKKAQRHD